MGNAINEISTRNVLTIRRGMPFGEASAIMFANRIRHLPVIDEQDRLIGIVSQKDRPFSDKDWNQPVEQVMSSPVSVVFEATSVDVAVERMLSEKISSLVVIGDDKRICGILTTEDVLRFFLNRYREENEDSGLSLSNMELVGNIMHTLSQAGI